MSDEIILRASTHVFALTSIALKKKRVAGMLTYHEGAHPQLEPPLLVLPPLQPPLLDQRPGA
jgi:hypothetical protein